MTSLVLLMLAAGPVQPGDTVYVRGVGVKLMAQPDGRGKAIMPLRPGQSVVWLGADPTHKEMQHVCVGAVSGYVSIARLGLYPPAGTPEAASAALERTPPPPEKSHCTPQDEERCAALVQLSSSSQFQREQVMK
jgi:hypothetical protein